MSISVLEVPCIFLQEIHGKIFVLNKFKSVINPFFEPLQIFKGSGTNLPLLAPLKPKIDIM